MNNKNIFTFKDISIVIRSWFFFFLEILFKTSFIETLLLNNQTDKISGQRRSRLFSIHEHERIRSLQEQRLRARLPLVAGRHD